VCGAAIESQKRFLKQLPLALASGALCKVPFKLGALARRQVAL
jgi:hypothetical protein